MRMRDRERKKHRKREAANIKNKEVIKLSFQEDWGLITSVFFLL